MKTQLTFSQALAGFELHIQARRLSIHTQADYFNTFRKFAGFLGQDPPLSKITPKDVETFLAEQDHLSKKTLLNYHTGLSALWTWAVDDGLVNVQILHKVAPPRPEQRDIQPFSEVDIRAMLNALNHSRTYTRPGKKNPLTASTPPT